MASGPTVTPILASLTLYSWGDRVALLVSSIYDSPAARNAGTSSRAPGSASVPRYRTPSISMMSPENRPSSSFAISSYVAPAPRPNYGSAGDSSATPVGRPMPPSRRRYRQLLDRPESLPQSTFL